MEVKMDYLRFIFSFGLFWTVSVAQNQNNELEQTSVPCYKNNRAQRCQPPFVNAAYGRKINATNTCGVDYEIEYCLQTGVTGARKYCNFCNRFDGYNHPSSFLNDYNDNDKLTWWQSETMLQEVHLKTVNLTVNFKKAFDITFVNLRFYSPRPESFAIFKRASETSPWTPYQYYSASCEKTYGLVRDQSMNNTNAICTPEYSDISPLTGSTVAFSTLEGRPDALSFSRTPELQEWVTATDIRIVLTRMNTFGDQVFGDEQVLKSYFYAISDLGIGARCKCNGHASDCRLVRDQNLEEKLECVCEHYTTGPDCGQCLPFYNDQPWGRANEVNVHECQACDCSGLSRECVFDQELFDRTGHGGRCINCRDNTAGAHCESCEVNHYRVENRCLDCQCDAIGSETLQCDGSGQCPCKPGVEGRHCDRCQANYYDFGESGCSPCECEAAGSVDNQPRCDTATGKCVCKENVDGRRCNVCKPGFFGLSEDNPYGCIACFCYGHSSECSSASNYFVRNITSDFNSGNQRWTAVHSRTNEPVDTKYNGITENLGVSSDSNDAVYFVAPSHYLEDQRFSYNQNLSFDLNVGEERASASRLDIVLEGQGKLVKIHIFAQSQKLPGVRVKRYSFRLHENNDYQWAPRLSSNDFIALLSNLTALKIRATYSPGGVGFIDNIKLTSATQGFGGEPATWIENCVCPQGYIGQFCESCLQGYTRDPPMRGAFARCVPCQCNNHSDSCDVNTGRCICQDNTEGDHCDRCSRGFYGDASVGTTDDCTPCPCPNGGACLQMANGDVVCTECEDGYGGNLCNICLDGYYGDPLGELTGQPSPCAMCACNGNIDPNAVANCNTTTGECLKCIHNTDGFHCENCLPNFFNNSDGDCVACNCYPPGTVYPKGQPGASGCDANTGQCQCQPNVVGRQCDKCEDGFFNITSMTGCQACSCDRVGSLNFTCELGNGQCDCKNGVDGRQCDVCQEFHFGFSDAGCQACNCDPVGSENLACDDNGFCQCKPNVDGRNCDRCMENKQSIGQGCVDCPKCYDLVQEKVGQHRAQLRDLYNLVDSTNNNSTLFNDEDFIKYMSQVNDSVNVLLREARSASTGDSTIAQQLDNLRYTLNDVMGKCSQIANNIASAAKATKYSKDDVDAAEAAIKSAENALKIATQYIENEGRTALKNALKALEDFGQNNEQMTKIAVEATQEAKRQLENADLIERLAKKALATAEEAHRIAKESLNLPHESKEQIALLKNDVDEANRLYMSTKAIANSSLARAIAAKNEAYELLQEAQQQLPSVDVDQLKQEAQDIKDRAEDIKTRSQNLIENNERLLQDVMKQTDEANMLLNDGDQVLSNITYLLSEVSNAKAMAMQAVADAEKTMKEANETLETLNDFDEYTNNEQAAKDALDKVEQIKETIQDALDMTQDARDALDGVEADAKRALKVAQEAEKVAQAASKEADDIRNKAQTTKTTADDLEKSARNLKDNEISELKDTLEDYESQYEDDMDMSKEVLRKAATTKKDAQDAHNEVSKAHDMVKMIKDELDKMGSLDMNQLRELEKTLMNIEEELEDKNLQDKIEDLSNQNRNIETKIVQTENELTELRAAVKNIGDIKDSLPVECFKVIPIEEPVNTNP